MKIGVMADSHDNVPYVERAVRLFNREKVDLVIHCGDFIAPFSLAPLARLKCEWRGVFGNNDGERAGLTNKSDGRIVKGPLKFSEGGCKIFAFHGHEKIDFAKAVRGFDVVLCGHTHIPGVRREEEALVVNPGETCGWLRNTHTVALVEIGRDYTVAELRDI